MKIRKNYRRSYENLYKRLCFELNVEAKEVMSFSNNELLKVINELLVKWNCTPLSKEELEMELI